MKFLVDRCAGRRLADWLRAEGHDVAESREREPDPGDEEILQWAVAEHRVLVTMDKDFGDLVFVGHAHQAGIIRLPDVPPEMRIVLIRQVLADVPPAELAQAIVTVRGDRIRISRGPGRGDPSA